MCDGYDDVDVAFERGAWRRANREHVCFACEETIRKGDRHHYHTGRFEGEWHSFRHCARCWGMIDHLGGRVEGPVQLDLNCGEVWENPPDDVAALAFMTRDEMQRIAG